MTNPPDPPWAAVVVLILTALPLLLIAVGTTLIAIMSMWSRSPSRRQHARQLIRELTSFVAALRSGRP